MHQPTQAEFIEAGQWLAGLQSPLLLSHVKPDGDALGSLIGLRALLKQIGINARAVVFETLPEGYEYFRKFEELDVLGSTISLDELSSADGVIVIDTCTFNQLEPVADWLRDCNKPIMAIDHHVNRDELASHYLVDEQAAAACLILYDLAKANQWTLSNEAMEALFIGISTDTGWFRFSNADARVFAAGAELATMGIKPHEIHQALFQQERAAKVRLLGKAISSLELLANDQLAVMTLTPDDYLSCEAGAGDTENIVNEPLRIGSVAASIILVDRGEGKIRCSFRSKPPTLDGDPDVDVSVIAASLGGGGHRRAAATRIESSLPDAREQVLAAFAGAFE